MKTKNAKTIKIDTNIPMPTQTGKGRPTEFDYPWADMKTGNSFLVEANTDKQKATVRTRLHVQVARLKGKKVIKGQFTTRTELAGIRVWKVK